MHIIILQAISPCYYNTAFLLLYYNKENYISIRIKKGSSMLKALLEDRN